jgi:hypothetical protein
MINLKNAKIPIATSTIIVLNTEHYTFKTYNNPSLTERDDEEIRVKLKLDTFDVYMQAVIRKHKPLPFVLRSLQENETLMISEAGTSLSENGVLKFLDYVIVE